jgi:hypothetical protein
VGDTLAMIFHVDTSDTAEHYRGCIMYAEPMPVTDATRLLGRHMPGGKQIDLTRHVVRPDVCHVRTDLTGGKLVCDTNGYHKGMDSYVWVGAMKQDADGPYVVPRFLVHPKSSWRPHACEASPSFTPDTRSVVFNSDYGGVRGYGGPKHVAQAYLARGVEVEGEES